jgi:hypothetical protein
MKIWAMPHAPAAAMSCPPLIFAKIWAWKSSYRAMRGEHRSRPRFAGGYPLATVGLGPVEENPCPQLAKHMVLRSYSPVAHDRRGHDACDDDQAPHDELLAGHRPRLAAS